MAVSTSALTLAQYAIQSNDPWVYRITDSLLRNGSILGDIPLANNKSLVANGVRWQGNLPTVNWSNLNVDPTVTSGTPTPFQEQAYIVRNAIDVDRFLVQDKNAIQDPRVVQMQAYLKSLAYDMNDKFINNNHVTGDSKAPVGLRYRLDNPTTYGVTSEMLIDGGGVDMTGTTNQTSTTSNTAIELLQQTLDYMGAPGGDGVVFYMNDTLKRRFSRGIRSLGAGGGWNMQTDAFGRTFEYFQNAKIVDIGRKADQSTRIILNTEANTGAAGSSTYTSLYAVRYGEDATMGWQFDELASSIHDIGLIGNGGSTYRTVIDWAVGLFFQHTRGIARVYDIKIS